MDQEPHGCRDIPIFALPRTLRGRGELRTALPLQEFFCRNRNLANPLSSCTQHCDLDAFDFIGNFDAFEASVQLFSRMSGLEQRPAPHLNANEIRSRIDLDITPADRRFLRQLHQADMLNYARGLMRFEKLLAQH